VRKPAKQGREKKQKRKEKEKGEEPRRGKELGGAWPQGVGSQTHLLAMLALLVRGVAIGALHNGRLELSFKGSLGAQERTAANKIEEGPELAEGILYWGS
jgi:hypothetical protein